VFASPDEPTSPVSHIGPWIDRMGLILAGLLVMNLLSKSAPH
jgi:hypothetical protein